MSWFEKLQGGPIVQVVGVSGDRVMFRTERDLSLGKVVAVRLGLPQGAFRARVLIQNVKGSSLGGFMYTSRSDTRLPEVEGADRRQALLPRVPCRMRVCSPALPRFQVMSVDFSRGGLQVESLAPVPVGRVIPLSLHIETPDLPILECRARVVWCDARTEGGCLVGLEFWEPDPWTQGHLDRFELFLTNSAVVQDVT
ncbi:MAG: PilZ domain-containing protein [Armatimonadetes bacterium]|nr:PilZ domain-containing protein [Armatimonadota bacterium]